MVGMTDQLERKWSWHNQSAVPTFGVTRENQEKYQDFHSTGHDEHYQCCMFRVYIIPRPPTMPPDTKDLGSPSVRAKNNEGHCFI